MVDFGLLVLRAFVGLVVAAHGSQKLLGWFGGSGLTGTQHMAESLNVHPPIFWAWVAALDEVVGGLLLALGFLMPLGPLLIFANMLFAILRVHSSKGFWNSKGGVEFPLTLLVVAAVLGLIGPGPYSVDGLIGFSAPEPGATIVGMFIVVIGFYVSQLTSRVLAHGPVSQGTRP